MDTRDADGGAVGGTAPQPAAGASADPADAGLVSGRSKATSTTPADGDVEGAAKPAKSKKRDGGASAASAGGGGGGGGASTAAAPAVVEGDAEADDWQDLLPFYVAPSEKRKGSKQGKKTGRPQQAEAPSGPTASTSGKPAVKKAKKEVVF